jgi:sec-independent protein translocase protein TatA
MPFRLGPMELIIILVIVMVIFGVGRLPEIGGAMGKAIREFRKSQSKIEDVTQLDSANEEDKEKIAP